MERKAGYGLYPSRVALKLQFFAQSGAEPPEAGEPSGGETPPDLNELLKSDAALQSQFDKLLTKAMNTAKSKWERERDMTAEQLAASREQEMQARERELAKRELRATALATLGEKGLPTSLIGCVSLEDEERMAQSIREAETALRQSVDEMVRSKLKGAPPKGEGSGTPLLAVMRRAAGLK